MDKIKTGNPVTGALFLVRRLGVFDCREVILREISQTAPTVSLHEACGEELT